MAIQRVLMTDSRKEDVFYEEAIKTLRTNMQFSGVETKSIVIRSCYPNEGKSDVTFQLAVEIGKMGKKVLIIDADIRKSNYVKRFQVEQKVEREEVAEVTGTNKDDTGVSKTKHRESEKIYPNDPCPCGSGKKYKKCCGRKK